MKLRERYRIKALSANTVVFLLFAVPFLIVGVVAPTAMLQDHFGSPPPVERQSFEFVCVFAAVTMMAFGGTGLFLLAAAVKTWRDDTECYTARKIYPNQPWRWRRDWDEGEIRQSPLVEAMIQSAFAVIVSSLSWGLMALLVLSDEPNQFNDEFGMTLAFGFVILFCAIGMALVVQAIIQWSRFFHWRTSHLHLATTPVHPGGPIVGMIELTRPIPPSATVLVEVSCSVLRSFRFRRSHMNGQNHSYRITVYQKTNAFQHRKSVCDSQVPIWINVPDNLPASNRDKRTEWKIALSIEEDRNRFRAEFDIPVFRVEGNQESPKLAVIPSKRAWCNEIASNQNLLHVESISKAIERYGGTVLADSADRFEMTIPLDSSRRGTKDIFVLCAVACIIGWSLLSTDLTALIWLAVPLILVAHMAYRRSTVQRLSLAAGRLGFHCNGFAGRRWTEIDASDIQSIKTKWDLETSEISPQQAIIVQTRQGERISILQGLPNLSLNQDLAMKLQAIADRNKTVVLTPDLRRQSSLIRPT